MLVPTFANPFVAPNFVSSLLGSCGCYSSHDNVLSYATPAWWHVWIPSARARMWGVWFWAPGIKILVWQALIQTSLYDPLFFFPFKKPCLSGHISKKIRVRKASLMWTKDSLLGVSSGKSCTLATSISTVEIFCSRCPLDSWAKMDIVLVNKLLELNLYWYIRNVDKRIYSSVQYCFSAKISCCVFFPKHTERV